MKIEAIPDEIVDELLAESTQTAMFEPPKQHGPLRQFDNYYRCASRGCSSPTFFKVKGIPRCMIHALRELNDMLVELGVEK